MARGRRVQALFGCAQRLSDKKRLAYVLHEMEGLTPAEIGNRGSAVLTVRTRLFYARRECGDVPRGARARRLAQHNGGPRLASELGSPRKSKRDVAQACAERARGNRDVRARRSPAPELDWARLQARLEAATRTPSALPRGASRLGLARSSTVLAIGGSGGLGAPRPDARRARRGRARVRRRWTRTSSSRPS